MLEKLFPVVAEVVGVLENGEPRHQKSLRATITSDRSAISTTGTMPDNYTALRGGQLDVMQAFEPFASQAEIDRAGAILYAASSRGPTVYTAFIATRSKVAAHRDAFVAVTHALAKMQQWLYAHNGKELAEVVAFFFPHVPHELLVRSLQRYLEAGLWARDPAMSKEGFERLGSSFLSGGALKRSPVFENCADVRLA